MSSADHREASILRLQTENDSLRRAVAELTTLNEISREIGGLVDLDEVLRRIVSRSVKAVNAEEGVITLVDDQVHDTGKTLIRSMATSTDREPFHLNEHIIGWMQLHGRPLRVERGAENDTLYLHLAEDRVRTLLSVPLLARTKLVGVLTVYNRRDGGAFNEGDQRLLAIIGSQSAQIIENARLHEHEKAMLAMRDELRVAADIQKRLLPAAPPIIAGYDLAGRTSPAREVGGDFFDYIPLDTMRTAVCVGDVSGKGLPAALLMASAQATLRAQADPQRSPEETVERVNWQMYRGIRRGSFLTLFYAELDHERHSLLFVNAGHNRPLLVRGADTTELREGGVAIGLMPRAEYQQGEATIEPGDLLLIYSDGLTEAMNPAREQFGESRLIESLRRHAHLPASDVIDRLLIDVQSFCGPGAPSDDITLAVIRRQ